MKALNTTILALAASLLAISCYKVPPPPGGSSDGGEIDANTVPDATRPDATPGTCGDGHVDPGEDCDSSGVNTANCNANCTTPACGDGILNTAANEQCDDGNTTDDGNGCDAQCRRNSVCGDGVVQDFFEACDDGNQSPNDGCSADCKEAVLSLIPVSDRAGIDSPVDGTFDYMNNETSTGEAIAYVPPNPGQSEEHRLAFEVDTSALHPTAYVEAGHFAITDCCLSGQQTLDFLGYFGNGAVELADFTQGTVITSFLAADNSPQSFDVQSFVQTNTVAQQWHYTGFLLKIQTLPNTFFNYGVETSNNTDPTQRPKLNVVFCVDADHNSVCD